MTGAMMPEGADTVVMQEETERSANGQSVHHFASAQGTVFLFGGGVALPRVGDVFVSGW